MSHIMYSNNQRTYNSCRPSVFSVLKTTLLAVSVSVLAACGGGGGGSEPAPIDSDTKAPSVTKVVPANGAKIAKNQTINITFSENVKGVNNTNVSLIKSGAAAPVALTIGGSGKVYTVKPNADLKAGASYTLMLKKAIADTAGNKMEADVSRTYTVSASSNPNPAPNPGGGDTTAPTISSLSPVANTTIGLTTNKRPIITVNFSENVQNVNTANVVLKQGTNPVALTITGSGKTYSIKPNSDLTSGATYSLEFKAGIKDTAGNSLVAVSKNYTAAVFVSISSISPADNGTDVSVGAKVRLTFSKAVTGVTTANVLLSKNNDGSSPVTLTSSGSGASYTFTPTANLEYDTEYFIRIKAANIKDATNTNNILGNADQVRRFKTHKKKVSFSAWVGTNNTLLDMNNSLPNGSELYSYRGTNYNDCNIASITTCSYGQSLLLNGQTMTNTAHTLTQKAFYKLKEGSLASTGSRENTALRFSTRRAHQVVWFKNKFWFIGGYRFAFKNDVWSSPDGVNWTQVKANKANPTATDKQFSQRSGHQVVVFKDKLWLIGGRDSSGRKNDVWSSSDGINWSEISSSYKFSVRDAHQVVVFKDKLWVIGGQGQAQGLSNTYMNDIWSSSDGSNWSRMNRRGGFIARGYHQVVVSKLGGTTEKLWVIGGYNNNPLNDVWSSTDGVNWTRVLADASTPVSGQFSQRYSHQVVAFDNKLWFVGGKERGTNKIKNDVWSSSNGSTWVKSASSGNGTRFTEREAHQAVVANIGGTERLYVIGGHARFMSTVANKNDVWRSEDGATWRKGYLGEITRP